MHPLLSRLSAVFGRIPSVDSDDTADRPLRLNDRKMEWQSETAKEQDNGISRRALLKYGGGAAGGAGILGGGWLLYDHVIEGRNPKETVRQYYIALDNGNGEKANGYIHDDSPGGGNSETFISIAEQANLTVEEVEIAERTNQRATVRATIHVEYDNGEEDTQSVTQNLRKSNGTWKIWIESDN